MGDIHLLSGCSVEAARPRCTNATGPQAYNSSPRQNDSSFFVRVYALAPRTYLTFLTEPSEAATISHKQTAASASIATNASIGGSCRPSAPEVAFSAETRRDPLLPAPPAAAAEELDIDEAILSHASRRGPSLFLQLRSSEREKGAREKKSVGSCQDARAQDTELRVSFQSPVAFLSDNVFIGLLGFKLIRRTRHMSGRPSTCEHLRYLGLTVQYFSSPEQWLDLFSRPGSTLSSNSVHQTAFTRSPMKGTNVARSLTSAETIRTYQEGRTHARNETELLLTSLDRNCPLL